MKFKSSKYFYQLFVHFFVKNKKSHVETSILEPSSCEAKREKNVHVSSIYKMGNRFLLLVKLNGVKNLALFP